MAEKELNIISEEDYESLKEEALKPDPIPSTEEEEEEEEEEREEEEETPVLDEEVSTDDEEEEDLFVEITSEILKRRGIEFNQDIVDLFIEENGGVEGLLNVLENLKPEYSHPLVEELDEYVSRGGDPLEWIQAQVEIERTLDLNTQEGALNAIRTYYEETTRWDSERIEKEISKIKTNEELEDELERILPELEEIKKEKEIKLFRELEDKRLKEEQYYKQYVSNVNAYVASIDTKAELGIPFTQKDKKGFFSYFINRGNDGLTEFEREIKDPANELKLAMLAYKKAHKGELEKVIRNEAVNKIESLARGQVKKTVKETNNLYIIPEDKYTKNKNK